MTIQSQTALGVAFMGALGVLARYLIDARFGAPAAAVSGAEFPWQTFAINVLGSALIGMLYVRVVERTPLDLAGSNAAGLLGTCLMTGFLGGFTTFSSFSLQTVRLLEAGHFLIAVAYAVLSPVTGIFAAWLGIWCARAT